MSSHRQLELEAGSHYANEPSVGPAKIRTVYIVDQDASFRRVMRRLIETFGFRVEEFSTGAEFLCHQRQAPDDTCLIIDHRLSGMSGLELQAELKRRGDEIPVVFLTAEAEVSMVVEAMRNGAVTVLEKPVMSNPLQRAIEEALAKSRSRSSKLRLDSRHTELFTEHARLVRQLSPREREVADLVATGYSNKRIAGKLGLSEKTIEKHRSNCVRKLRVSSSAEMVRAIVVSEFLELQ